MASYDELMNAGPGAGGAAAPTPTATTSTARTPIGGYVPPSSALSQEGKRVAFTGPLGEIPVADQLAMQESANVYYEGDEIAMFAGASYEEKYKIQRALVEAGLLTQAFRAGVWDNASQTAMYEALTYANQMGVDFQQALNTLATSTQVGPKPKKLFPNRAKLVDIVEEVYTRNLRRPPSKDELREAVADLRERHEGKQLDAEYVPDELEDADLPDYETEISPLDQDDEQPDPADIQAAFEERFKQRHAPEIAAVERVDDVRQQDVAPVFDGVATADAMAGSGAGFIPGQAQ